MSFFNLKINAFKSLISLQMSLWVPQKPYPLFTFNVQTSVELRSAQDILSIILQIQQLTIKTDSKDLLQQQQIKFEGGIMKINK